MMIKGIRERISSGVNLYLGKANIYREKDDLLVEYINKSFIREGNDYYYVSQPGSQKIKVQDEDMEWLVEIFVERLDERLRKKSSNSKGLVTKAKVINLIDYKNAKKDEE